MQYRCFRVDVIFPPPQVVFWWSGSDYMRSLLIFMQRADQSGWHGRAGEYSHQTAVPSFLFDSDVPGSIGRQRDFQIPRVGSPSQPTLCQSPKTLYDLLISTDLNSINNSLDPTPRSPSRSRKSSRSSTSTHTSLSSRSIDGEPPESTTSNRLVSPARFTTFRIRHLFERCRYPTMTFVAIIRSRNTEAFEFAAVATFLRCHVPV
jgi:hypothetical protein